MSELRKGLIVSCQACEGEPLYGYNIMHLFAKAAVEGGAVGIRALVGDVPAIKAQVDVPVIGLTKCNYDDSEVYITSTVEEVDRLLATECDVIAMDATLRKRHGGNTVDDLVAYIRKTDPTRRIMADVATEEDVINALRLGFDYVSTTLRGYTAETRHCEIPDFGFMKTVSKMLEGTSAKMVAEGGIFEKGDMERLRGIEPYAVVVGSAITRPHLITRRLAQAYSQNNRVAVSERNHEENRLSSS